MYLWTKNKNTTTTKQKIKPKNPCRSRELNPGTLAPKADALPLHHRVSSETYSRKYEELSNVVIHACKKYRKNEFVENVWPGNLALFIYESTHCVGTVKWLDYNRYSQLTRLCSGNASALGSKGPGFNPRLRQGFLCLIFCFVVVVFLLFLSKTHYLSQKFAIPFTILIYLVYFRYCKIYDRL